MLPIIFKSIALLNIPKRESFIIKLMSGPRKSLVTQTFEVRLRKANGTTI